MVDGPVSEPSRSRIAARQVGPSQRGGHGTVLRAEFDEARRAENRYHMVAQADRPGHLLQHGRHHGMQFAFVMTDLEREGEFASGDPRHRAQIADQPADTVADISQYFITGLRAMHLIDVAKCVDLDRYEHPAHQLVHMALTGFFQARDGLFQAFARKKAGGGVGGERGLVDFRGFVGADEIGMCAAGPCKCGQAGDNR